MSVLVATDKDVLATMRFNLNVYFVRKAKHPYVYLSDVGVEIAVTNLCRILLKALMPSHS